MKVRKVGGYESSSVARMGGVKLRLRLGWL